MTRENKIKYIGFRDTETYKKKIIIYANEKNMNISEFIRYCVEKVIGSDENESK